MRGLVSNRVGDLFKDNDMTRTFYAALASALLFGGCANNPPAPVQAKLDDSPALSATMITPMIMSMGMVMRAITTAASTIDRLIDQFPADRQEQVRTMLSESLKGVVSQVLCKKIGGGRVAAIEVLVGSFAVGNLIRDQFLVDAKAYNKVMGIPITKGELISTIKKML